MDAKERHELKDNDLAEFLENFGAFWNKHGNSITVVFMIFAAVWLGLKYYNNMQITRHETAWGELDATSTPQGYRQRAEENANYPSLATLALLRGAEAYHEQAIKLENESDKQDAKVMSPEDSLKNAESMYKQVYDSNSDPVFRANAAVGLANVAETRKDLEAAKTYWTNAKSLADEAGLPTVSAQAEIRLAMLPELAMPIVFAESTEATTPASQDSKSETPTEPSTESPASTPAESTATPDAQAPADPG